MGAKAKTQDKKDLSIEEKIKALYNLQVVDSNIDKIKILRGELPLEVQDLEDEIAGLETRIEKYNGDVVVLETTITNKKTEIKESEVLSLKYTDQLKNIKNNREFDSLTKELEFQSLEIELSNKKIKGFASDIDAKKVIIEEANSTLSEIKLNLEDKKNELDGIVGETQKEEEDLKVKSEKIAETIEERLFTAYKRIRGNARNGLAIAPIERGACGGCYNKIPPQRQLDIKSRKKIIVCEYCGRILVDNDINIPLEEVEAMRRAQLELEREAKPKRKTRKAAVKK